jgi:hypothetical protein
MHKDDIGVSGVIPIMMNAEGYLMTKTTIRTVLNNVIVTQDEHMRPAYTYHQKVIWSKRHQDECIQGQENDDQEGITNEPKDFVIVHDGDTSEGN